MQGSSLLLEENLGEVNRPISAYPRADRGQVVVRIEEVAPVAGALHPAVNTGSDRVDVTVRISKVLTHDSPSDVGIRNPLANRAPLGIIVREEVLFGHPAAVLAGDRQKVSIKVERRKSLSVAHAVHLVEALLFQ